MNVIADFIVRLFHMTGNGIAYIAKSFHLLKLPAFLLATRVPCFQGFRYNDNQCLRYATGIPLSNILQSHSEAKQELLLEVKRRTGKSLSPEVMTLGFARRATAYKRADLLFSDVNRLRQIVQRVGPLQVIDWGKAHPKDDGGKSRIRQIYQSTASLQGIINIVYLEDYDIALAKLLCSRVDLWLNTPQRPQEASGTSGMKAALNGVPSLSILDGWWIDGHADGSTGWSIGDRWEKESHPVEDSTSLYDKLENIIMPMFYHNRAAYDRVMLGAITLNGSFFNSQRMMMQYLHHACFQSQRNNYQGEPG